MGIPAGPGVGASGLPPAGDKANAVLSGSFAAVGPGKAFAFRGIMNLSIWAQITHTLTTTAASLSATVNSATGLAIGNAINSVNVPVGSTIKTLSGTTIGLGLPIQTYQGLTIAGYPQISGLSVTNGLVGSTVTGPGIPAGTTVVSVTTPAVPANGNFPGVAGTVLLSANVTSAAPVTPLYQPFEFAVTANGVLVAGADAAAIFTGGAISFAATLQLERSFDGGSTWIVCSTDRLGTLAVWSTGTPVSFSFGEPEKSVLYRLQATAYTGAANTTIQYRISQTGGAAESLDVGQLT